MRNTLSNLSKQPRGRLLAMTAVVSLPLAVGLGFGFMLYQSGVAVRKRLWRFGHIDEEALMRRLELDIANERDKRERGLEEAATRLEQAHRSFEVR